MSKISLSSSRSHFQNPRGSLNKLDIPEPTTNRTSRVETRKTNYSSVNTGWPLNSWLTSRKFSRFIYQRNTQTRDKFYWNSKSLVKPTTRLLLEYSKNLQIRHQRHRIVEFLDKMYEESIRIKSRWSINLSYLEITTQIRRVSRWEAANGRKLCYINCVHKRTYFHIC